MVSTPGNGGGDCSPDVWDRGVRPGVIWGLVSPVSTESSRLCVQALAILSTVLLPTHSFLLPAQLPWLPCSRQPSWVSIFPVLKSQFFVSPDHRVTKITHHPSLFFGSVWNTCLQRHRRPTRPWTILAVNLPCLFLTCQAVEA